MGYFSLFLFFLASTPSLAKEFSWTESWGRVSQLVAILKTVPEGKAIVQQALNKDPAFASRIKLGTASFTESTFSRTYSLLDGQERISLRHEITLNQSLSVADAVVDLAHELVHFTEKGMLDPYQPNFELSQFIRNGIEGEGGELKALAVECKVAWSLERVYTSYPQHSLCERYRSRKSGFLWQAAKRDYYALGTWYSHAWPAMQKAIPELSQRKVIFTSSYAGKPYPLALAEEYGMTRKAACANNRRKYHLIASQSVAGRSPASPALSQERSRLKDYDRRYCRKAKVAAADEDESNP